MVEIQIRYGGQLHTDAVHGPSGAQLATDAPVDNHGRGESFSPTDLVATALGTCMLTIMGIHAEREGWPLEGAWARVEKHMASDPVRRIGRLDVELHLPAVLDTAQREALRIAAGNCPVCRSLGAELEVRTTVHADA